MSVSCIRALARRPPLTTAMVDARQLGLTKSTPGMDKSAAFGVNLYSERVAVSKNQTSHKRRRAADSARQHSPLDRFIGRRDRESSC